MPMRAVIGFSLVIVVVVAVVVAARVLARVVVNVGCRVMRGGVGRLSLSVQKRI